MPGLFPGSRWEWTKHGELGVGALSWNLARLLVCWWVLAVEADAELEGLAEEGAMLVVVQVQKNRKMFK